VDFFAPILVGQNVDDIPELWGRMYHCGNFWCRVGLGLIVLNGIEAALWDLKGKLEGKPVHALLGGAKHAQLRGLRHGRVQQLSRWTNCRERWTTTSASASGPSRSARGSYHAEDGFAIENEPSCRRGL
jgi:L-alanine-DL-glutamate epimerase-like enolase superfamily enzyme